MLSVPEGGFPEAIAEIRERLGDKPLLLAGMVGSNRGWKEAPYVPCPAGIDDLVKAGLAGRARGDRARRILIGQRPRRRHARRGGAAARRRRRRPRRSRGARLPSRHAQQMGAASPAADRTVPDGHDRRDLQPAEGAQHPRRPACRATVETNDVFKEAVRYASATKRFPPICSRCARECCSARRRRRMLPPIPAAC